MNDIDRHLKQALRRCEPGAGFTDRVLAQLSQEGREKTPRLMPQLFRFPTLRWGVAVLVIIGAAIGVAYRQRESQMEEARALAARQQVMVALRITGSKLRIAKHRVKAVEGEEGKTENSL